MKLSKITKGIFFVTALALVYIHMQMQIFGLAYQGTKREHDIRELSEENGNVTYNILRLKSASNIGYKLLEDSDMRFLDKTDIVSVETAETIAPDEQTILLSKPAKKPSMLLSLFSIGSEAQARPQE